MHSRLVIEAINEQCNHIKDLLLQDGQESIVEQIGDLKIQLGSGKKAKVDKIDTCYFVKFAKDSCKEIMFDGVSNK